MELSEIVVKYASAISGVDELDLPPRVNQRTGRAYLPGVKSMSESDLITRIDEWWSRMTPSDFRPAHAHRVQVPYPGQSRNKCDHLFTTDGEADVFEWAVELKFLQLVGDNGKRNDFAVTKALSPYLKDRSLFHDVGRLISSTIARRKAVIAVCFSYSDSTCSQASALHPEHAERLAEIRAVCEANGGQLSARPLVEFADGILRVKQIVRGGYHKARFEAWKHPCGGHGTVVGWEVISDHDADDQNDW